ncbi:YaeQ family protein [Microbacterium gorillae]|uniref:YaeQ family protein n=1 Tax=Microbacterium gorillae TaxID=1231063 RepID=UPI00058EF7A2|nr:YaeQ family protein [Microbacterium gorillae]
MALGSVMHTFTVSLADVDRGVYEDLTLRLARHPSETDAYMMTRLLAYLLEYAEGIAFTDGLSQSDEPAVLVRDLTGRILTWIEVGAPDAERMHLGTRQSERTALYTHRDADKVLARWQGKRIHDVERVVVRSFEPGFIEAAAGLVERRNEATVSVSDHHLYLDLNGTNLASEILEHPTV